MPVSVSYPGIYIEELPSNNFTITPAPTSITVFVGYTHPFKTRAFDIAVQVFNFTEFEQQFGGYLASGVFDGGTALALRQFFLNGGSDAYVVGLKPQYHDGAGNVISPSERVDPTQNSLDALTTVMNPSKEFTIGTGSFIVYGLEPTDQLPMKVMFVPKAPLPPPPPGVPVPPPEADVQVTYGSRVETFRNVKMTESSLRDAINARSSLIRIRFKTGVALLPVNFDFGGNGMSFEQPLVMTVPTGANLFDASQFNTVLQVDSDLDKVPVFNLMVLSGISDASVLSTALKFCEDKFAFLIMDPPFGKDETAFNPTASIMDTTPKSTNGAIYFPYLVSQHPVTGNRVELPPSGTVAGVYARTDTQFGVWKAPAGIETGVRGVKSVIENGRLTKMRHGILNNQGVNALRSFPGIGTVVYGARTLVSQNPAHEQWRYVPVRRMALFIEQTLKANLTWVVFRPNDEPLWAAIRASITGFMMSLFRQGALKGDTPSKAFQVKVDSETTTETDINLGKVNIIVAFAPLKPAEFVIVKIAQLAGQAES